MVFNDSACSCSLFQKWYMAFDIDEHMGRGYKSGCQENAFLNILLKTPFFTTDCHDEMREVVLQWHREQVFLTPIVEMQVNKNITNIIHNIIHILNQFNLTHFTRKRKVFNLYPNFCIKCVLMYFAYTCT